MDVYLHKLHTCQVHDFRNNSTHDEKLEVETIHLLAVVAMTGIFTTKYGFEVLNHHELGAYPMIPRMNLSRKSAREENREAPDGFSETR